MMTTVAHGEVPQIQSYAQRKRQEISSLVNDIGGPLLETCVSGSFPVGILSACVYGLPDCYFLVSGVIDWIEEQICVLSDNHAIR